MLNNENALNEPMIKPQTPVKYTGIDEIKPRVGEAEVKKAYETLEKYKEGKKNLENRLIENEQWWKMRHWESINSKADDASNPRPASGWLFNCIISKHADAIEAYPTFNCLPREQGDVEEAKRMSDVLPVILKQNDFEKCYSDVAWQKLKGGTGCYGVFWDSSKLNGLGDIAIKRIDLLNLFYEPGIENIQDSKNVFYVELIDNDILKQMYPQLESKLTKGGNATVSQYIYDDNVDTSEKSVVVDWYYHTYRGGRKLLHFCKFCNNEVLYASENEPELMDRGWYDHGMYPFELDALFPVEGTPCGFGYIDVCREPQKYIDILNQAIIKNATMAANPRFFIRGDGSINEEEFLDVTKPLIHVYNAQLGDDSFKQLNVNSLDSIYVNILNSKIDELKETSGNRDVNNGGAASGVTAASAIAAMQEQSGKTSRDSTKSAYRSYEKVVLMCIELIRQFYDMPRQFRITGQYGREQFISYDNSGIQPQRIGGDFGMEDMFRLPVFDLIVSAQKESPYSKLSQNELALQFYQLGFFNPQMADQALACLDMMDFDHKDMIQQKLAQAQSMQQQLMLYQQLALTLAQKYEPQIAQGLAQNMMGGQVMPTSKAGAELPEVADDGTLQKKNTIVENAKARSQQTTQPS